FYIWVTVYENNSDGDETYEPTRADRLEEQADREESEEEEEEAEDAVDDREAGQTAKYKPRKHDTKVKLVNRGPKLWKVRLTYEQPPSLQCPTGLFAHKVYCLSAKDAKLLYHANRPYGIFLHGFAGKSHDKLIQQTLDECDEIEGYTYNYRFFFCRQIEKLRIWKGEEEPMKDTWYQEVTADELAELEGTGRADVAERAVTTAKLIRQQFQHLRLAKPSRRAPPIDDLPEPARKRCSGSITSSSVEPELPFASNRSPNRVRRHQLQQKQPLLGQHKTQRTLSSERPGKSR
uniref:FERM domain-containing protein n=1 Tax=Macrostomum lignano TaxID=282301 RepID=A0A1I8IJ65_9PLAT